MKNLTPALLITAKNVLKTRVNCNKIDLYEMRFEYRGETFKIAEAETMNHWRLLKLPYTGACMFIDFSEFDYNPFE